MNFLIGPLAVRYQINSDSYAPTLESARHITRVIGIREHALHGSRSAGRHSSHILNEQLPPAIGLSLYSLPWLSVVMVPVNHLQSTPQVPIKANDTATMRRCTGPVQLQFRKPSMLFDNLASLTPKHGLKDARERRWSLLC